MGDLGWMRMRGARVWEYEEGRGRIGGGEIE